MILAKTLIPKVTVTGSGCTRVQVTTLHPGSSARVTLLEIPKVHNRGFISNFSCIFLISASLSASLLSLESSSSWSPQLRGRPDRPLGSPAYTWRPARCPRALCRTKERPLPRLRGCQGRASLPAPYPFPACPPGALCASPLCPAPAFPNCALKAYTPECPPPGTERVRTGGALGS